MGPKQSRYQSGIKQSGRYFNFSSVHHRRNRVRFGANGFRKDATTVIGNQTCGDSRREAGRLSNRIDHWAAQPSINLASNASRHLFPFHPLATVDRRLGLFRISGIKHVVRSALIANLEFSSYSKHKKLDQARAASYRAITSRATTTILETAIIATTARRNIVSFMRPVNRVATQNAIATPGAAAAIKTSLSIVKSP